MKADVSVRSRDEIVDAIRALTDAQWIRLRKASAYFAWVYDLSAADLLQEAFCRALAGGRQCPTDVDVVRFLVQAMRSIANGEGDKIENQVEVVSVMQPGAPVEGAVDLKDSHLGPEEIIMAAESAEAIRQAMLGLFPNDRQARDLVDGIPGGLRGRGVARPDRPRPQRLRQQAEAYATHDRQALSRGEEAMTRTDKKGQAALNRLADALVDDVLAASDQEILTEFSEAQGDPAKNAADMRALFERTVLAGNKRRLKAAQAGVAANRIPTNAAPATVIAEARRRLRRFLASGAPGVKLTLAARNESELSDADVLGTIEDLLELGVLLPDDDKGGGR